MLVQRGSPDAGAERVAGCWIRFPTLAAALVLVVVLREEKCEMSR
jgi:hypothetical protein